MSNGGEVVIIALVIFGVLLQVALIVLLLRFRGSVLRRDRRLPSFRAVPGNGMREDTGLHQLRGANREIAQLLAGPDPEQHVQ